MEEKGSGPESWSEDELIWLEDEDGTEVPFSYLDLIQYKGDQYVVLEPMDEADDGVVILQVEPPAEPGGEDTYYGVEDDRILNAVFQIFKQRFRGVIDFGE